MAVAVRISPKQMTKDDYERVMSDMRDAGHGSPDGRQSHTTFGEDRVEMFDVWDSEESFQPYRDRLMTAMQDAGVDAGAVIQTDPVHRFD